MDALCEFIEFWLGPRQSEFGESAEALGARLLPMPLRRLYEFAGRWPSWETNAPESVVPAFSCQDSLVALPELKGEGDKIVFLWENQGVWDCRTLADEDDPPVWCHGDHTDEQGHWFTGEKLVCDSLSRFLVTFVLQEVTLGSKLHLCDENLSALFDAERHSVIPVWTNGPYVHESLQNYFLWRDVLVGNLWGDPFFAANSQSGLDFLLANQGRIDEIRIGIGQKWSLDIQSNGSARLRYLHGQSDLNAEACVGAFEFENLVEEITAASSDTGHYADNPITYFRRKGQSVEFGVSTCTTSRLSHRFFSAPWNVQVTRKAPLSHNSKRNSIRSR